MDKLLFRLLCKHISIWQMIGFALANLCGMAIIVTAIQFAADTLPIFSGKDSFMRSGQIVITKRISTFGSFSGSAPTFSPEEISDIKEQPFAKGVGLFLPSQYKVYATLGNENAGMELTTQMFFESLPDEFIDVDLSQWTYREGSDSIPIIIPQSYLNLYNFGFATSQGLPAISEGVIKQIGIRLVLSGDNATVERKGKVVAFSRSINTILVPQSFMQEYNRLLSPERTSSPSRLVVMTNDVGDNAIADYLEQHGYDTEGNSADSAKAVSFIRIITFIIVSIGCIICFLSFYVLLLSIFLIMQKHTYTIDSLLLIGYSPGKVAMPFHILAIGLNTIVTLCSVWVAIVSRAYYLPKFGELYPRLEAADLLPALCAAIAIYITMCLLNYQSIRRRISLIWDMHR